MIKIVHQRKKCIGCGACAIICPKLFVINNKDGLANLKNSKIENRDVNCVKKAADICPIKIIKIQQ